MPDNGLFAAIFGSSDAYKNHIRRFYALVSAASACEYDAANRGGSAAGPVRVRIYPHYGEYASEASIGHSLTTDRWERLSIDLPNGVGNSALRIDPAEQAAIIDISVVALRKPVDGQILWAATGASEVGALTTGGTLTRLTSDKNQEFCRFISSGTDPQLFLPALKAEQFDQPIVLEVWMRVQASAESVVRLLLETDKRQSENGASDAEHAEIASKRVIAEQHLASLRVEHEDMMRDLEAALHERNRVLQQHKTLIAEREACATEKESLALANRKLHSELYVAQTDLANARAEIATARLEFKKLRECREDRQRLEQAIEGIVHSYSWRITQPLRSAMLLLRGRPRSG